MGAHRAAVRAPETPCDALTRGQSLYTFELFPDDIVELNSQALARRGIKVLTVYDALNDNRNIESSVRSAHAAGMQVNAMMTYTLSPVHTDEYYVERARELVQLQADFISIKDPTGLLTPERGRTLFPAVVQRRRRRSAAAAFALPVGARARGVRDRDAKRLSLRLHGERAAGQRRLAAVNRGHRCARARGLASDTSIDRRRAGRNRRLLRLGQRARGQAARQLATYDPALYEHQVPGGMISNLRSQLEAMQMGIACPRSSRKWRACGAILAIRSS